MKADKFKEQVSLPFEQYLKEAFREQSLLHRQYHYLLLTADDSATRKTMAQVQASSKANGDTALTSSAEGSVGTKHDGTGVPKERVVWSHGLTSHKRRAPNPEDDDDAEYIAQDEEDVEIGAPDTSRSKSTRIGEQLKRAKRTPEAM